MADNPYSALLNQQQPQQVPQSSNPYKDMLGVTQPQKKDISVAEDVAKSGATGLAKGAIQVAGTGGDLQSIAERFDLSDWLLKKSEQNFPGLTDFLRKETAKTKKSGVGSALAEGTGDIPGSYKLPTSEQIQGAVEDKTGKFYKPQTIPGEYAQTVGEFLPGSVAGGAGTVRGAIGGAVRYGVAPAVASETAGQLTKGSQLEPYARGGAALVTGGAAALTHRPGTTEAAIRSQMPAHVNAGGINAAEQLMQEARSRGVRLSWDEALSQVEGRPVLQDMRRVVESAPQSRETMRAFTEQRPQEVQGAVRSELDQVSPQSVAPNTVGPRVGQAAEETLNDVRQAINRNDEPSYRAASTVLLSPQEMRQVYAIPGYDQARNAVRNDPQLNRDVWHLPENSVGFLNEVKKQLDQMAENARTPLAETRNVQRAVGMERDATNVRDTLTRSSSDYAQALASQAENRQRYLEPLMNGPLGRLANRDIETKNAIKTLFERNPLPGSEDEIHTAVSAVARRNPDAARELVRAHVEMTFNEASRALGAQGNQFSGAKLATQIAGNPQQRANLREAITALPNGRQRWEGFNRLLDVLEATGQRQPLGSKTTFNQQELELMSKGGVTGMAQTAMAPQTWMTLFKDKVEQWRLGRNLNQLADILTSQESGPLLRRIANMPTRSQSAISTAARLIYQTETGARGGGDRLYVSPAKQAAQ